MASSRLSQTTRATDRADHLHGEPSMAPRSERCDGQPVDATTSDGPRGSLSAGASKQVRRVYEDFATALVPACRDRPRIANVSELGAAAPESNGGVAWDLGTS